MTKTPPARRVRSDRIRKVGLERHPLADLYHLVLTASWTSLFAGIVVLYFGANAIFAVLYYLDRGGIENASGYGDAFFFSVQTMATIGYGKMVPTGMFANILVTIEALFGLVGLAMATGLMFAKLSRPTARVLFTKFVVLSKRDGVPSLMIRLANERAAGLVEATIRLVLMRDEITTEGESIRRFYTLPLVRSQTALFALSWLVVHPIDEKSPLFGVTAEAMAEREGEIIASVVGIDGTTADTVHARHTWATSEILFGKRFADILERGTEDDLLIDYRRFHDVEDAPL